MMDKEKFDGVGVYSDAANEFPNFADYGKPYDEEHLAIAREIFVEGISGGMLKANIEYNRRHFKGKGNVEQLEDAPVKARTALVLNAGPSFRKNEVEAMLESDAYNNYDVVFISMPMVQKFKEWLKQPNVYVADSEYDHFIVLHCYKGVTQDMQIICAWEKYLQKDWEFKKIYFFDIIGKPRVSGNLSIWLAKHVFGADKIDVHGWDNTWHFAKFAKENEAVLAQCKGALRYSSPWAYFPKEEFDSPFARMHHDQPPIPYKLNDDEHQAIAAELETKNSLHANRVYNKKHFKEAMHNVGPLADEIKGGKILIIGGGASLTEDFHYNFSDFDVIFIAPQLIDGLDGLVGLKNVWVSDPYIGKYISEDFLLSKSYKIQMVARDDKYLEKDWPKFKNLSLLSSHDYPHTSGALAMQVARECGAKSITTLGSWRDGEVA